MTNVLKVALDGYDAFEDTDPDHFSLYVDGTTDNILIKEKERGTKTVNTGTTGTVTHSLGYIPYVIAFAEIGSVRVLLTGTELVGSYSIWMDVTASDVSFINATGSTVTVKYYIFYDNQQGSSSNDIPLSNPIFAVAKRGVDVKTATDPNDFIFRSDLNTFKIVGKGTETFTVTASSTQIKTKAHGLSYIPTINAFSRKASSSNVIGVGQFRLGLTTDNYKFFTAWADSTNLNFELRNDGFSDVDITVAYYLYEVPL